MAISAGSVINSTRPLSDPGRWWRALSFGVPMMIGILAAWSLADDRTPLLVAAVLTAAIVAATALPWRRWPVAWQVVPPLGYFGVTALVTYAAAGSAGEFLVLVAIPSIWLMLFHSRRQVLVGLAVSATALVLPPLLYPAAFPDEWQSVAVIVLANGLGTLGVNYLVHRMRTAAAEAQAAERRAAADRDLLYAYLNDAGCLVVVLEAGGRISLFNRFAERVTGYSAEQMVGQQAWAMAGNSEPARQAVDRLLAGEGPVYYEDDLLTRSGDRRRIAWSGSALVDEQGRVTHTISTGLDITEQRQAERLFENVLAAAQDQMIFATDPTGRFTVFNTGGERMLGYRADELVGKATVERIHVPVELQAWARRHGGSTFQDVLGTPADIPAFTRDWTLLHKDGTRVLVSMTISPMRAGGVTLGYAGVARDVTAERAAAAAMRAALDRERQAADRLREAAAATEAALRREREATERLRELDTVKNDFVAMVSHDLRTPLTSIVGNIELVLDGDAGTVSTPQRRLLEAVSRNGRRLQNLIGDLLMLSRIESGTLRINTRSVPLAEVVDGALEAVSAQKAADVTLATQLPEEPVLLEADPSQLERVLTNLIGNALKFTPPGGRVAVEVTARPERVELRISDTGVGIPADELPHIFDRFFRTSRSQSMDRTSTGLGLTIAKSIVERHRGSIWAESTPGAGSTFFIDLPRVPAVTGAVERERSQP
jgi:hypothetical protein